MNLENYEKTPSFYNSQEVFEKYLGQTSYYTTLQKNIIKLCKLSKCKQVLELGCATGATVFAILEALPDIVVTGVDMREDIIKVADSLCHDSYRDRARFLCADFCQFDKFADYDFISMLYSFHHIEDPEEKKWDFLKKVYQEVQTGTYLCIGETFLPCDYVSPSLADKTRALWELRVDEGFASTFWSSLQGLTPQAISLSGSIAEFCGNYENIAGKEVEKRETEFLITVESLKHKAAELGWNVVICQACNAVGESIVLLQK